MIFLWLVIFGCLLRWLIGEIRSFRKGREAYKEVCLLQKWLLEQIDDCSMSDEKWQDLIPLCVFADLRVAMLTSTSLCTSPSCTRLLRSIISDNDEEESEGISA